MITDESSSIAAGRSAAPHKQGTASRPADKGGPSGAPAQGQKGAPGVYGPRGDLRHPPESGFSIRARLLVMLALFALLPVLVVTYLASKRIATSLELMKSPGVTMTLDHALAVSKISLNTLENALHAMCINAAEDPSLAAAVAGGGSGQTREALDSLIRQSQLNYAALYTKQDEGAWSLAATVTMVGHPSTVAEAEVNERPGGGPSEGASDVDPGPGAGREQPGGDGGRRAGLAQDISGAASSLPEGIPSPELPHPLAPGVYYDSGGWLLDAVPTASLTEERDGLLVLGYHMGTEFFDQVQGIGKGVGFYRRLDVLKGLYVGGIWLWAAALLLVVGTATLITARFAARSLSSPLVELADGMRRVARSEETVLVQPKGSRETRSLANSFNAMVEELAAYKKDLARAERAAAWQDIARVVAHEIRNPLTPIQFAIRRMRDRLNSIPESEKKPFMESLDSILGEVDTLKALASSFSQFAKLPEPSPTAEDLNKLASEAADLFSGETNVSIRLELDPALPHARADAGQIRMALNNLLKNSLEAMPHGGTITVSTGVKRERDGTWAYLEVKDTGVGMSPETLARARDAYFSTKAKGSGLGLAVIEKIVSQHAGRLELASRPGEGTTVSLLLPVALERPGEAGR